MWSQNLTRKWKCSWRSREEQYKVARCSRLEFSAGWHHLLSLWHLKVWNLSEWTHIHIPTYVRVTVVSFLWNARKSLFIYCYDVFYYYFGCLGKGWEPRTGKGNLNLYCFKKLKDFSSQNGEREKVCVDVHALQDGTRAKPYKKWSIFEREFQFNLILQKSISLLKI